jgi:hypothetical protein
VPTTYWTTPILLAVNHNYRWWVRAVDAHGGPGSWSAAMDFNVSLAPLAAPTLVGPAGPITDLTPTFSWNVVPDAHHYDIWVSDLTTGQTEVLRDTDVRGTEWTPEERGLVLGHAYRWWVRACTESEGVRRGGTGPWSNPLDFAL